MSELLHDIEFGEQGNGQEYTLSGWGTPEGVGGHTWTVGVESLLAFTTPDPAGSYVLAFRAKPWLHPPEIERQRVLFGLDDQVLAMLDVTDDCVIALDIPSGGLHRRFMIGHVDSARSATFDVYRNGQSMGLMMRWIRIFKRTHRVAKPPRLFAPFGGRLEDGTLPSAIEAAAGLPMPKILSKFESLGEWCQFGWLQQRFGVNQPSLLRYAGLHLPDLVHGIVKRFDGIARPDRITSFQAPATPELFDIHDSTYRVWWHTGKGVRETDSETILRDESVRMSYLQRKFAKGLVAGSHIYVLTVPVSDLEALAVFMALDLWRRVTMLYVTQDGPHSPGSVVSFGNGLLRGTIDYTDIPRRGTEQVWLSVLANAYIMDGAT